MTTLGDTLRGNMTMCHTRLRHTPM
ncbi:hypothetical protein F383_30894 [Gossypium arboreum]|uniref:Uncharacterized protein n=1 Tax=Gossypium arboreum TaxID=29729 RepID=A0A0B0MU41_GOSAR|nr:hypothetical protein F383_30894 [Gossypium arboreum]